MNRRSRGVHVSGAAGDARSKAYQVIADGTGRAGGRGITARRLSVHERDGRWGLGAGASLRSPAPAKLSCERGGGRAFRASTYRPRSVSSLLMRLRAMVRCVWVWNGRKCVGRVRVASVGVGDG